MEQTNSNNVVIPAASGTRFAFHPLETKLTEDTGMIVQTIQFPKDSAIKSQRVKVPAITMVAVQEFIASNQSSAIAESVLEFLEERRRNTVFKQAILNGSGSIAESDCSLEALNNAIQSSVAVRISKEEISKLFDSVLVPIVASMVAEKIGIAESATQEIILGAAAGTIKKFRAAFLMVSVKDSIIDQKTIEQMEKIIRNAESAELLPVNGNCSAVGILRVLEQIKNRTENPETVVEL